MSQDWFVIKNFDDFINASRKLVFNYFGNQTENLSDNNILDISQPDQDELDKILSYDESVIIAKGFMKKQVNKNTSAVRFLINEKRYENMIYALNNRMVSNILNNLVNKGMIETAFDTDANDFVFWVKDEHKKKEK